MNMVYLQESKKIDLHACIMPTAKAIISAAEEASPVPGLPSALQQLKIFPSNVKDLC